jgi:chemotaxis receptor (MCP) glutamine deamidase CheD
MHHLSKEKYVLPGPDQVRFISGGQTLSLVMGSCISTVFVARKDRYILAANHIMIARERDTALIAKKSARRQIDDILDAFRDDFGIDNDAFRCLHLVGAGKKSADSTFHVHSENISETLAVLEEKSIPLLFNDTWSHYFATYSMDAGRMSVFIEDKLADAHLSYILDLERLFNLDLTEKLPLPASALKANDPGFEELVNRGVIVFITGEKNRPSL